MEGARIISRNIMVKDTIINSLASGGTQFAKSRASAQEIVERITGRESVSLLIIGNLCKA